MFCHCSLACRNLVSSNMGIKFRVPLQKLHPLSRAIHHRFSGNTNPPRAPNRTAARYFTSMSRLPMRSPKPPSSSGGRGYQQQRSFWVARLASRLLKLRYILLGTAVGGGYTAKKVSTECMQIVFTPNFSWIFVLFFCPIYSNSFLCYLAAQHMDVCHCVCRLTMSGRKCCPILVNTTGSFLILSGS